MIIHEDVPWPLSVLQRSGNASLLAWRRGRARAKEKRTRTRKLQFLSPRQARAEHLPDPAPQATRATFTPWSLKLDAVPAHDGVTMDLDRVCYGGRTRRTGSAHIGLASTWSRAGSVFLDADAREWGISSSVGLDNDEMKWRRRRWDALHYSNVVYGC